MAKGLIVFMTISNSLINTHIAVKSRFIVTGISNESESFPESVVDSCNIKISSVEKPIKKDQPFEMVVTVGNSAETSINNISMICELIIPKEIVLEVNETSNLTFSEISSSNEYYRLINLQMNDISLNPGIEKSFSLNFTIKEMNVWFANIVCTACIFASTSISNGSFKRDACKISARKNFLELFKIKKVTVID